MNNYIKKVKSQTYSFIKLFYSKYYKYFSKRCFPEIIIFGAMKSGTTSLFHYLKEHPDLLSSSLKEPSFFSWNYNRGINNYLNYFPKRKDVNNGQLIFEGSVTYLHHTLAAKRIKQIIPNIKLIAILRDPIERAISHYNYYSSSSHFTKKNPQSIERRDIEEAFLNDISGLEKTWNKQYCRFSLYGLQLNKYYQHFNSSNILILDFNELKNDPKTTLDRVSEFLEIDSSCFSSFQETKKNIKLPEAKVNNPKSKELKIYLSQEYTIELPSKLENKLKEFFKEDVKMLHSLTGKTYTWSAKYL